MYHSHYREPLRFIFVKNTVGIWGQTHNVSLSNIALLLALKIPKNWYLTGLVPLQEESSGILQGDHSLPTVCFAIQVKQKFKDSAGKMEADNSV